MGNNMKMGAFRKSWEGNKGDGSVKSITFCVTEECNFACKYCYMTGKNNKKKMSFETAKKCVDYILNDRETYNEDSVIWDFIGGEPFLEIDLIDKLCDYIKFKMFELNHPWFDSYRFNFSSNGVLYSTEKVQNYIKKNRAHLSIGISVDGNKEKHDLQRVYRDGRGTYDDVLENVKLWLKQFPEAGTKATFASDDLPLLKDSIISLWKNGIKAVSANVVFEDVWKEGDDLIFEEQLNELGDYILENKLWDDYYVRFFDAHIGTKLQKSELDRGVCGSGKMLSIDCDGNFFPCIRFLDFSLNKRKGLKIGSVDKGIKEDNLRPFRALSFKDISDDECMSCEVASGCSWCVGHNYDEYGTIFSRAKYICKMHKANVRANKRFWKKYESITGNKSPRRAHEGIQDKKFLQIILDENMKSTCLYTISDKKSNKLKMSRELFEKAIKFADDNDYEVVLLGDNTIKKDFNSYYYKIVSSESKEIDDRSLVVYDNCVNEEDNGFSTSILLINKENIDKIPVFLEKLSKNKTRINIILQDVNQWQEEDMSNYNKQLDKIVNMVSAIREDGGDVEINTITDPLSRKEHCGCDAGESTITLAPDGNLYICPAFYFDQIDKPIGNIEDGINKEFSTMKLNMSDSALCKECDAYQCKQCKYLNKKYTGEYKISPKNQCIVSNLEKNKSEKLKINQQEWKDINIKDIANIDPLVKFERRD